MLKLKETTQATFDILCDGLHNRFAGIIFVIVNRMAVNKNNVTTYDLIVIGGGASGLAGAIEAKLGCPFLRVAILEKNSSTGVKIRATGNGRCNIANESAPMYKDAESFFEDAGIITRRTNEGWLYPYSESADDVVRCLENMLAGLSIDVMTSCDVKNVKNLSFDEEFVLEKSDKKFVIETSLGIFMSNSLIIATGGKAGPAYGTCGDGYKWARKLGHSVKRLVPVLTGIECDGFGSLAGVRQKGIVNLYKHGNLIFSESGEVQFNADGISGICVFNATRFMRFEEGENINDFEIVIDFIPDSDVALRLSFLDVDVHTALATVVKGKLLNYVIDAVICTEKGMAAQGETEICGSERVTEADESNDQDAALLRAVVQILRNFRIKPTGLKGWKNAQCTSGGVPFDEIDIETCESKFVPNLYFTGEILDYDGPCGGYNLTNAWASGLRAGRAIAQKFAHL